MMRKLSSPLLFINVVLLSLNLLLLWSPDQVAPPSLHNVISRLDDIKWNASKHSNDRQSQSLDQIIGSHANLAHLDNHLGRNPKSISKQLTSVLSNHLIPTATPMPTAKPRPNYKQLRTTYVVPDIQYTKLVNCAAILANRSEELAKAQEIMSKKPKVPIYEETYMGWTKNCDDFKHKRGYIQIPLTQEEEMFPLAFSISMFKDVEGVERLLRAIYQPQNIYCIHIDTKTSLLIHRTMHSIADCFDNVFIASHVDKVKWGDVSVLLPALNCMKDLVK